MVSLSDATVQLLANLLLTRLGEARHVTVLTGAGMSAESGIPTFRDAQSGMWAKYRAEDLATPEAFEADPERVWQWYEQRREKVRSARPHPGHHALVALDSLVAGMSVITQNVDGLHQLAGTRNVTELHGNILRSKCHVTGRSISAAWLADYPHGVPRSPYVSHGFARPDVVWFGEILPRQELQQAMDAAACCEFFISVGTTSLVQPAARLPLMALEHGASLIEINPLETPLSLHADQCFRGKASEVLSSLVSQLKSWKRDLDQDPQL
jgi:NAD-dependent deacetylase